MRCVTGNIFDFSARDWLYSHFNNWAMDKIDSLLLWLQTNRINLVVIAIITCAVIMMLPYSDYRKWFLRALVVFWLGIITSI